MLHRWKRVLYISMRSPKPTDPDAQRLTPSKEAQYTAIQVTYPVASVGFRVSNGNLRKTSLRVAFLFNLTVQVAHLSKNVRCYFSS